MELTGNTMEQIHKYPRVNSDPYGTQVLITKDEAPQLIDQVSDTEIYLGWAVAGSLSTDPVWKIKRIKQTGTVWSQMFPSGDERYLFAWSDRITLVYL